MQKKVKVSFEVGYMDCKFNIQKIWRHDNTLFVLSKFTMPCGIGYPSEDMVQDEVSIELDHDLPISHFLIIYPPLPNTDFEIKGYNPTIINQEADIPENVRMHGECLYKAEIPDSESTINNFVTNITKALSDKLNIYNTFLDDDQKFSAEDLQNSKNIKQLLNKNEHTKKEQYIFFLLRYLVSNINYAISSQTMSEEEEHEVIKRLSLLELDISRLLFLAAKYESPAIENIKEKVSNTTDTTDSVTKPNTNPSSTYGLSKLSFFTGAVVAIGAAVAVYSLTSCRK